MIDIQEQKKVRKRSLIFVVIVVLLFAALWLAAVIETRNVEVTVRDAAAEEVNVQRVTNPFLKRIFLKADRQIAEGHRTESEKQYFNAEDLWQFSVQDGKDAPVRYYWIESPENGKLVHGSGQSLCVMEDGKVYRCTDYTAKLLGKLELLCQWHLN